MAKVKVVKDNNERWLLTYADLMNLLLILFIVFFAMSQVDTVKFQQLSQSFSSAFGNGPPPSAVQGSGSGNSLVNFPATMPSPVIPSKLEEQQIEALEGEITGMVKSEGLSGDVSVQLQERGIVISIEASLIFKSGRAEIEKLSLDNVLTIGRDILSKLPDKHIRIEGHTDNVGSEEFNLNLSELRAKEVYKYLVSKGIVEERLIFKGYGYSQPIGSNDTSEGRALNRRTEFKVTRK